jgi:hypothetical protein
MGTRSFKGFWKLSLSHSLCIFLSIPSPVTMEEALNPAGSCQWLPLECAKREGITFWLKTPPENA